jgi:hypothetical protein
MTNPKKKLIEVALPLGAINAASSREKLFSDNHRDRRVASSRNVADARSGRLIRNVAEWRHRWCRRFAVRRRPGWSRSSWPVTRFPLSVPEGRVELRWWVETSDGERRVRLRWTERGGPPVEPPERPSFGTRLIRRAFASEPGGGAELDFAADGVRFDARFPAL